MARPKLKDTLIEGELAERLLPDGRRSIKLKKNEREELAKRRKIEAAVALFLDVETSHTWAEIAAQLDISVGALKDLTKDPLFTEIYNTYYVEISHDPRLKAVQIAISDMLPAAIQKLNELLTGKDIPATVRLKAIEDVIRLGGYQEPKPAQNDKKELAEFLAKSSVQQTNIQQNITMEIPEQYARALNPETVEGQVVEDPES